MPLPVEPSLTLILDFVITTGLTVALFAAGLARAGARVTAFLGGAAAWAALTGGLAAAGLLAHFDPPRPLPLLLLALAGVVWFVRSDDWGGRLARLPLALIVGFQGFRILVEFVIHRAAMEGVAPVEMSWSGHNFDVLTGLTACALIPFAERLPAPVLHAWNVLGLALLGAVVGTGMLSMPGPFQQIATDPANVWIGHFPFIWLPTILVVVALIGHGVLFRRLREDARATG